MARGSPNHDPELRHWKASDGRARREAATRAAPDAGWRPGDPLVGGDLWDSGGEPRNTAEPIRHRRDDDCDQRRPRRGAVGVRGHYAQEPHRSTRTSPAHSILSIL